MKIIIYITGIAGGLLLVFRILGIFMAFPFNNTLVIAAVALLGLVFVPLYLIDRHRHNKKIEEIIKSGKYRKKEQETPKKGEYNVKGWDMNTSPFRDRKSGLRWEGGNIKGVNAKRESRRRFLR
jgi:hypothetical protein